MYRIYLSVNDSDIYYRHLNFKFYFSSRAIRERFIKKIEDYSKNENLKLQYKFPNVTFDVLSFDKFFSLFLYSKLEKRGFKVEVLENLEKENKVKKVLTEIPIINIEMSGIDD